MVPLTGALEDGTPIRGEDVILVIDPRSRTASRAEGQRRMVGRGCRRGARVPGTPAATAGAFQKHEGMLEVSALRP